MALVIEKGDSISVTPQEPQTGTVLTREPGLAKPAPQATWAS
jgi:hypothetical protein